MKTIKILFLIIIIISGCSSDNGENPVASIEVTISDSNEDGVWNAGPEQGILGNTDIWFIPATLQGSAIWVINGPGSGIGFDVSKTDNPSLIYFGDSYIDAAEHVAQTGTLIPQDEWIHVRVIIYEDLPGWVIWFLNSLTNTFFSELETDWIQAIYEADIQLVSGAPVEWIETSNQYLHQFDDNQQRHPQEDLQHKIEAEMASSNFIVN